MGVLGRTDVKIFISYRRADSKYVVDRIRDRLIATYGDDAVFRDIESIPPGQNFSKVLDDAIAACNVMLVVIGPQWTKIADAQGNKRLFDPADLTRLEVETGLARKEILVIPVLVMYAPMPGVGDIPESIADLLFRNAVSVRNDPDFNSDMLRLIQGIDRFVGTAQIPIKHFEPETIYIPAGSFWMGGIPGTKVPNHETPAHEVVLSEYRFGKHPVTNEQYEEFVRQTQRLVAPEMRWDGQKVPEGVGKLPVVGVTWYDAMAYCEWLSKVSSRKYSLPNEAQWEKACRAGNQCIFPWGDEFDAERCNHGRSSLSPVDAYPPQNEFGCFDLVGNVLQWTCTRWGKKLVPPDPQYSYPWKEDGRNSIDGNPEIRRVMRGSSMTQEIESHRCSHRSGQLPSDRGVRTARHGFRVVLNID